MIITIGNRININEPIAIHLQLKHHKLHQDEQVHFQLNLFDHQCRK